MAIGLAIGVLVGTAMKNIGVGIAIGVGIGIAFATAFDAAERGAGRMVPTNRTNPVKGRLPKSCSHAVIRYRNFAVSRKGW